MPDERTRSFPLSLVLLYGSDATDQNMTHSLLTHTDLTMYYDHHGTKEGFTLERLLVRVTLESICMMR